MHHGSVSLVLLAALLVPPTVCNAAQLREMQYEFITTHSHTVPRADDVAFLFIESTITDLVFDSNNLILDHSVRDPGLYRLRLKPGHHILTTKADGFVPLSGIRLNAEPKRTYALRITPKTSQPRFDRAGRPITSDPPDWDPQLIAHHVVDFKSAPPGAEVRIDGEYRCLADCSLELPEGEHQITFRLTRYADHQEKITILGPMTVHKTLTPLFGWITVKTEPPGLAIELDGLPIGKSPIVRHEIDPGRHTVKIVDPYFHDAGIENFLVTGNEHREFDEFRPAPRQGALRVRAVTADGKRSPLPRPVRIGDREVGHTPWAGQLMIGPHRVSVDGQTRTVTVKEQETQEEVFEIPPSKTSLRLTEGPRPAVSKPSQEANPDSKRRVALALLGGGSLGGFDKIEGFGAMYGGLIGYRVSEDLTLEFTFLRVTLGGGVSWYDGSVKGSLKVPYSKYSLMVVGGGEDRDSHKRPRLGAGVFIGSPSDGKLTYDDGNAELLPTEYLRANMGVVFLGGYESGGYSTRSLTHKSAPYFIVEMRMYLGFNNALKEPYYFPGPAGYLDEMGPLVGAITLNLGLGF